ASAPPSIPASGPASTPASGGRISLEPPVACAHATATAMAAAATTTSRSRARISVSLVEREGARVAAVRPEAHGHDPRRAAPSGAHGGDRRQIEDVAEGLGAVRRELRARGAEPRDPQAPVESRPETRV